MKKNLAFTIAELIIALSIIGALGTMLIMSIKGVNKKIIMYKKAYHIAERNVHDIVNDEDLYPTTNSIGEGLKNYGKVTYNDVEYGCNDGESSCGNTERNIKFCKLFGAKLNTVTQEDGCKSSNTCNSASFSNKPSFATSDGIYWYLPKRRYEKTASVDCQTQDILIDVNGKAEPNCEYTDATKDSCKDPDRFRLHVDFSGKITITKEINAAGDTSKEYDYLISDNIR